MNKNFINAPWDSAQSTYKQIIHFENGKSIIGYSKRRGFSEPNDKTVLLQNWILRSYRDGYLDVNNKSKDPVSCIEYHWKNKSSYVLGFILYQDYVEWNPDVFRDYLDQFLVKFFNMKQKGIDPYEKLYATNRSKRVQPLNLTQHRFMKKSDLRQHCLRVVKDENMALGEVKHFYIEYVNKWLNGYDNDDVKFFEHQSF